MSELVHVLLILISIRLIHQSSERFIGNDRTSLNAEREVSFVGRGIPLGVLQQVFKVQVFLTVSVDNSGSEMQKHQH